MSKEHSVIFIPGLGDDRQTSTRVLEVSTNHWRDQGLEPVVHTIGWYEGGDYFQPKLERLVKLIDDLAEKRDKVSLVGISAGGSAALNAYIERRGAVNKVVNICGRLRKGEQKGFRSFEARSASSPTFAQSVQLCEANINKLSIEDKQRIMTVRALFGDELVPADTTIVEGAYNTRVPTPEHIVSITAALTVFSKPIILFLKGGE